MDIYSVWPPISYLFSLISLIVFELVNLEKKPTIWKISNIKWAVLYRTYHHYFECFPLLQFMSISVNEHLTNNLTVIIMNLLLKVKSAHTHKKNLFPSDYKREFWNEQVVFFWVFWCCLFVFVLFFTVVFWLKLGLKIAKYYPRISGIYENCPFSKRCLFTISCLCKVFSDQHIAFSFINFSSTTFCILLNMQIWKLFTWRNVCSHSVVTPTIPWFQYLTLIFSSSESSQFHT